MASRQATQSTLELWQRLLEFHRGTIRTMDESLRQRFGQSLDDYDVLHQLAVQRRPMCMGDLADRLLVANSSCNRLVGRLVDAGYVSRNRGEVDRRQVEVSLTTAGRRLYRRMAGVHRRDIERLLGSRLSISGLDGLRLALDDLSA